MFGFVRSLAQIGGVPVFKLFEVMHAIYTFIHTVWDFLHTIWFGIHGVFRFIGRMMQAVPLLLESLPIWLLPMAGACFAIGLGLFVMGKR